MKKRIVIADIKTLNPMKTFECGQCFRWNKREDNTYFGIVGQSEIIISVDSDRVIADYNGEFDYYHYFDLERDYETINKSFMGYSEYLDECIREGTGIRILRQDPWETIISFLISQCNNIPRIQGIIERLCISAGTRITNSNYTFPDPSRVLSISPEQWESIRAGYRSKYIVCAANTVVQGFDLRSLKEMDWRQSKELLMQFRGVGSKVADCVNLYGLEHMESFPVDTWIRKALRDHFEADFNPEILGEYAGLAQQYIFYHERQRGRDKFS